MRGCLASARVRLSGRRARKGETSSVCVVFPFQNFIEPVSGSTSAPHQNTIMLELRPACENCNTVLPPDSTEAMICSFECTFCRSCVENILRNVCPNCGGGFCSRPIRPKNNWNGDNSLGTYPASTIVRHRPVDPRVHRTFADAIRSIPPELR